MTEPEAPPVSFWTSRPPDRPLVGRVERATARRVALVAVAMGVLAELLLDGPAIGINIPLATLALLGAAWFLRRRGRAPDPLDAWLPVTAIVLASLAAVRADPFVAFLDIATAAAFCGASVAAFSGLAVTRRSLSVIVMIGLWVVGSTLGGSTRLLAAARSPERHEPRALPRWLGPVARGLFLAVPLALIFAVLFASADPIFGRAMRNVLGFEPDLGDLPGRLLFVLGVAWLAGGLLVIAAAGIPAVERASLGAAVQTTPLRRSGALGTTEALIVLVAVDLVVGLFVALQLAYLFGGVDTLTAAGMTYSTYARRGYFELVAAAGLAGGVLVALEYAIAVRSRAYLGLAVALVGLTIVVLASAALRLQLYQDAYGWTELRLYVAVSIVALAVALATLAAFIATDRTRWLGHALAVVGVVSLIGLNVLAPPAFVAERNLARIIDPSLVPPDGRAALDADYLEVLPADAIPAIVEALPRLPAAEASRLRALLLERRVELATDPAYASPFAWNLGIERARDALDRVR